MIRVSYFKGLRDTHPHVVELDSLEALAYAHREHLTRAEKKHAFDAPLFSVVEYREGTTRAKVNVERIHVAVFDLDHLTMAEAAETFAIVEALGVEHWVYSTWGHCTGGDDDQCYRLAFAISRPILAAEWPAFFARMRAHVLPRVDDAASDASRMFFLPAHVIDSSIEHVNVWVEGAPLDVDEVLSMPEPPPPVKEKRKGPKEDGDAATLEDGEVEITEGVHAYCVRKLRDFARRIRALRYPGPLYPDLNEAGFTCGRFVPLILSREEVDDTLWRAVLDRANGDHTHDAKNRAVLDKAIDDGMAAPWIPKARYALTDWRLARKLFEEQGEGLAFVPPWGKWLGFDGVAWNETESAPYAAVARLTVSLVEESAYADDARAKELRGRARALGGLGPARQLVAMAEKAGHFAIAPSDLDTDPMLLACPNGTVDLRTGALRASSPDDMITKRLRVPFDAEARAPVFERFVHEITCGDRELARYLQRAIGYSITGVTSEHCLFFLYGDGANGKSTLLDTLAFVLGDACVTVAGDLLLAKRGEQHPTGIAALAGRRLAVASEVEEGRAWDEPLVKSLTGGDLISARRMREDFWTFAPTHKLWIAGNYRPHVKGSDAGIWRRIRLLPFLAHFGQPDRSLGKKLRLEAPGILAWAVRGCLDWQAQGLGEAKIVTEATGEYRSESNVVGEWLDERWEITGSDGDRVGRTMLYTDFGLWCEKSGAYKVPSKGLVERLRKVPGVHEVKVKGLRQWSGLKPRGT